ncbi:lytic polysaccharide monooxygenase [Parathielavia appendiculata]|uniref:Lytic polysaccharide monooxygenase n=1 Tax=Parathielavia appendiculata TaxID=2587402 RepID=A0AAN6TQJ1_9PEZI|nr:lytic polysaccharide monooxygenase [Parathielavia appendiculata]
MATTYTAPLAAALALLGMASGHMIMNTPTPYNYQGTAKLLQVDPLDPTFPFPCQGVSEIVSVTPITAGTTQLVKFTGGAQHGGGSCQFSLTYDYPPPADKSKWKTIYTLIGGCPVSAAGNLHVAGKDQDGRADGPHCGNDSGVECIRQFDIPIPKDLPNGNATFAWTWFNKIGNREVYMNCAPVTITGGLGDDRAFFDGLPDLFLANVPGECTTGNGVLNIPQPGKYGKVLEQPTPGSEGDCPKADGVPTFEGDSGNDSGSSSTASLVVMPIPSTSTTSASLVVVPITTSTTVSTSATTSATASSGFVTQTTTPPVISPVPSATSGAGSSSGPSGSQPCPTDGAIICFSPTSFGLCNHGAAIPQPVAPGTTCNNGKVVRRSARLAAFW